MLTISRLKEMLEYNPLTGVFTWRKTASSRSPAGSKPVRKDQDGYLMVMLDGKNYRQHRLAWFYVHGLWPANQLDHINGVRDDNRIANLRECDEQNNNRNRSISRNNKSGASGVHFQQNKWMVRIRTDRNTRMFFGYFDDFELAELVAAEAREKYHGNFAKHNLRG